MSPAGWVLLVLAVWLVVSALGGLLLGASIRWADDREPTARDRAVERPATRCTTHSDG